MSPDTPMSQHRIKYLMKTLRRANVYHSQLAAASRAVSHPARKARKHAQALRLSISVEAASTLDHRYISTIPLPVLDLVPSPPPGADHVIDVSAATTALKIVAPIPRYPSQIENDRLATELPRPVLRCDIHEEVVSSVPCILASQWSASTTGTGETEEGDDEEDIVEPDVPQPAQIRVRYPRTDDNENTDILVSPDCDDDDQENDKTLAPIHAHFTLHLPRVTIQVPPENDQENARRPPLPTRIHRRQQQEQRSSPQAAEAGLAHLSSGSDSSHLSLELVTPVSLSSLYFRTSI